MRHILQNPALPHWLVSILFASGLITCFGLLFIDSPIVQAQQHASTPAHIDVIRSDEQAVELEFHLGSYTIANLTRAGVSYQQLLAEGMVQSAATDFPEAPTLGAMIGIPTTAGVTVEVVEADVMELAGIRLPPAPQYVVEPSTPDDGSAVDSSTERASALVEKFDPQPVWGAADGWLPNAVVSLGQTGALGAQPVAQVQFTPVQYNPLHRQLKLYTRIRARITWAQNALAGPAAPPNPTETALEDAVLANKDAVRTGRMKPTARAAAASAAVAPETTYEKLAKTTIITDGLYQISYADLVASGIDPTRLQDPNRLAIYNHKQQAAIDMRTASAGQTPWDAILFYGTKIRNDNKLPGVGHENCPGFNSRKSDHWYTETNVYWLVLLPPGETGLRMSPVDVTARPALAPNPSFRTIRHFEQDTRYWQTLLGQECEDHWFWGERLFGIQGSPLATRSFTPTVGMHADNRAAMTITLRGYSTATMTSEVSLNGGQINGSQGVTINVVGQVLVSDTFDAQLHDEVTQTMQITALPSSQPGAAQFFVDSFDIDYQQLYSAANQNEFVFGKSRTDAEIIQVNQFTRAPELFDISDPLMPARVRATAFVSGVLTFTSTASTSAGMIPCQGNLYWGRCYLAVAPEAIMRAPIQAAPPALLPLISTANSADYVIITDPEFVEAAQKLAQYRRDPRVSGLATQVVTVESIYDEFNDGIANPAAIRDFLDYAYHCWDQSHKLAYVLLLGDASQDYKNRLGNSWNYVPSFNFESSLFGEISSDSWFANLISEDAYDCATPTDDQEARDALPDLFMGRIPVASAADADMVIAKIVKYESTPTADWMRNVLFVSDDEQKFRTTVDILTKTMPFLYNITPIMVTDIGEDANISQHPPYEVADKINSAIGDGQLLVTYIGHGDYNAWGRWDAGGLTETHYIYHIDYVEEMPATGKLPLFTVGDCLNGYFAGPPERISMAEKLLLKPGGGAIAVWAPTGLGYPSGHRELLSAFNNMIFGFVPPSSSPYDGRTLGVAARTASLQTYAANSFWQELIHTYVLFGDPAMRIHSSRMNFLPVAAR
ncbi:MAG: C25 family cysteine peptidase [Caldilineaceae bacterium]